MSERSTNWFNKYSLENQADLVILCWLALETRRGDYHSLENKAFSKDKFRTMLLLLLVCTFVH